MRRLSAIPPIATALLACCLSGSPAPAQEPPVQLAAESTDASSHIRVRALVAMEALRKEIVTLAALRDAQAALLSWMRAAALAFGSQGGLARRGWEIARMLDRHGPKLSAVYRFRDLMLHYHGFTVMPPVLAETGRAFRLERSGTQAARAERILRIVERERIVSAVPQWRDFLVRDWPEAVPPAPILFPRDEAEARQWRRWLREGWRHGTALAADIFGADLERLNRVFEGLVLWRRARLAGMVSAPALETARTAVSGHEGLMRIDETVARLGDSARFELRPGEWKPLAEGQKTSEGGAP